MSTVAITTRRDSVPGRDEVRDGLEMTWWHLLYELGHVPLVIPNHMEHARSLIGLLRPDAVLLTGGGNPDHGNEFIEREHVESFLIKHAHGSGLPLLGVCRGMQAIALQFGGTIHPTPGHVGVEAKVNSRFGVHDARCFHEFGLKQPPGGFVTLALAVDGSVEAIEHATRPIRAIMWHPERSSHLGRADASLLQASLGNK